MRDVRADYHLRLLHRLPPKHGKGRPPINEIQPDLHPLEILYDVRKLLQEEHGQPLTAAFRRITEAMGLRDLSAEAPAKDEQWAHYAVQAIAWSAAGTRHEDKKRRC
jgi:anaphase-promoting complex subunit 5